MRPVGGDSCRSVSWSASRNTGSLVYCAMPFPRRNGRYARSRSRIRQPSIVVSSVSTIALQPQRFRARDEARDELVRRAPVELEPARCVAHRTRRFLHRARGLVREDERDALRGGCARDGHVRVAVGHLQDADRTEDERARQRRAEHLGRGRPDRDVAEHPRHDAPPLERRAVLAHRLLGARAARDVGVSLRRHGLSRRLLETLERDRNGRIRAPRAADVDLELSLAPDADGHACTLTAPP